jgi:hypothetical protein
MDKAPDFLLDGPESSRLIVAFTHGAAIPMDAPFMNAFALGLAARGWRVARFEFPYMARRRRTGENLPLNTNAILQETWLKVVEAFGAERLIMAGKSLGGRVASLVADQAGVKGLVCLGYPFHLPGKPEQTLIDKLADIKTPTLIVQGERDRFGSREEVESYQLAAAVRLHWVAGGDHHLRPSESASRTKEESWEEAVEAIQLFLNEL